MIYERVRRALLWLERKLSREAQEVYDLKVRVAIKRKELRRAKQILPPGKFALYETGAKITHTTERTFSIVPGFIEWVFERTYEFNHEYNDADLFDYRKEGGNEPVD